MGHKPDYSLDISVCDGKYRVVAGENMTGFRALRYDEEWRDLCGDKLVLGLCHEIEDLRETVAKERAEILTSLYLVLDAPPHLGVHHPASREAAINEIYKKGVKACINAVKTQGDSRG